MSPEMWRRVDEIYEEVMKRPPGERERSLSAACAGAPPEVRARVEELLQLPPDDDGPQVQQFERGLRALTEGLPACIDGVPESLPDFGHLERIRYLGHGGMGVVYKAFDRGLGIDVALKMLLPDHLSNDGVVRIFPTDARSMARLQHPHIVRVHHVDEHDGRPYFTMDWVDGESLEKRLGEFRENPRRAAELLVKVARAIHHAHQRGVLHRDLKPANILLDKRGEPHITDFGLAKQVGTDECPVEMAAPLGETVSRVFQGVFGTPPYMSPEQATPGRDVTIASDVYGLGAVLYTLLTGRPPFEAASLKETLRQVRETEPDPPDKLNPAVGPALARICLKCLEKEPGKRYKTAEALVDDLEHWLEVGEGLVQWLLGQFRAPCRLDRPRDWAHVFCYLAAWRVIWHAVMALLLQSGPAPAAYWAWFIALHVGTWLPVWWLLRSERRLNPIERGALLNWGATFVCDAILFALFCPWRGQARPDEVVRVYSAWPAAHGLWYVAEGRRSWGRFYAVGLVYFVAAFLLSFCGLLAPVAYALVVSCAMLWLGLTLMSTVTSSSEDR
jgi:hypothetical protein